VALYTEWVYHYKDLVVVQYMGYKKAEEFEGNQKGVMIT
jgi:hypothetical protein